MKASVYVHFLWVRVEKTCTELAFLPFARVNFRNA